MVSAPPGHSIVPRKDGGGGLRRCDETSQLRVVDYGDTRDRAFITANGRGDIRICCSSRRSRVFGTDKSLTPPSLSEPSRAPGPDVGITGLNQLAAGSSSKRARGAHRDPGRRGRGAGRAGLRLRLLPRPGPLVVAAVSILATFLVILGLTYITEVSFIVQFLVALVGLGVAIDYSLLLVTRWREERARGASNHEAVVTAVETAGRAVLSCRG